MTPVQEEYFRAGEGTEMVQFDDFLTEEALTEVLSQ